MAFDWYDLEQMDETELARVIDRAGELLCEKLGLCTGCHGSGRCPGDQGFVCEDCGGRGTAAAQAADCSEGDDEDEDEQFPTGEEMTAIFNRGAA